VPALRTWLFVPGDNPPRIPKAFAAGADVAVVDLEDAVAPSRKAEARAGVVEALSAGRPDCRVGVRLNALASGLLEDDVAELRPVWERIDVLLLPMTTDAETVREVCALLDRVDGGEGPRMVPLVETAAGVLAAAEIAAADPRVLTLALGPADLSAELGIGLTPEGLELLHVRSQLVLAAAAAGGPGPIDGPWLDVADDDGLARSTAAARSLGFSGKLAIHPRQLPAVRAAFAPTAEELAWAREVDVAFTDAEARGVSSIRLPDGTFVDPPVAARARALLAEAAPER
jgi:citrate lyase subunit beta/citryl-CoA lyase